jgi:hypothetical protein
VTDAQADRNSEQHEHPKILDRNVTDLILIGRCNFPMTPNKDRQRSTSPPPLLDFRDTAPSGQHVEEMTFRAAIGPNEFDLPGNCEA